MDRPPAAENGELSHLVNDGIGQPFWHKGTARFRAESASLK